MERCFSVGMPQISAKAFRAAEWNEKADESLRPTFRNGRCTSLIARRTIGIEGGKIRSTAEWLLAVVEVFFSYRQTVFIRREKNFVIR